MKNVPIALGLVIIVLLFVSLAGCVPSSGAQPVNENSLAATPTSEPPSPQPSYNDPFAYCAAIGTIDTPDARYTGTQVPVSVINGFVSAAGLQGSSEPVEMFQKTTIWRCMNNQVYACNFGANLPCSSKANTDKTPTQAMVDFCTANPDADVIPMSVTGHATIYSWHCVKDTPELLDQIEKVDPQGFLEQIWYAIQPNAPAFTPAPMDIATPEAVSPTTPTLLGGSGQLLFSSNRDGAYDNLYLLDFTTSQVTQLTRGDSNTFPGPFSPDGSQILFTGFGLTTSYIGVMNADGSSPVNLTNKDIDEGFPTWSPDGKLVAFTSRRDGNNEIYVMNADGSNQKRLTNQPTDDFAPAWSPDGTRIAFVSDRDNATGVYSIYIMNADGSGAKRLTGTGSDFTPSWSPDGMQIAFRSIQNGSSDIYTVEVNGSGPKDLTNDPAEDWSPAWSPDGTQIAFQTNRDGNWEIYVMNADGSDPRNLTQNPADDQMPYFRPASQIPGQVGMANPASTNCVEKGGFLKIEERADLGQFGVCYFEDNRQCEEWALFRGDCPVGGVKVTGYITTAGRFCAITGGTYTITTSGGPDTEQGTCTYKNGSQCDAWDYYYGKCSPSDVAEPTPEVLIQPLTVEVCNGQAQAMAHALNVSEVTQSEVSMSDFVNNASGTGCQSLVTGNGVQFQSPDATLKLLANMLVDEGWTEDPMLQAGGPTGIGAGYRKGNQLCLAGAIWHPDASANCPSDQPITACNVTAEQQIYTITLDCGVENK